MTRPQGAYPANEAICRAMFNIDESNLKRLNKRIFSELKESQMKMTLDATTTAQRKLLFSDCLKRACAIDMGILKGMIQRESSFVCNEGMNQILITAMNGDACQSNRIARTCIRGNSLA